MAVGRFNGALAGDGGAYKSTDGGSTWTLSSASLPASPVVNWITYSKGSVTNAVFVAVNSGTGGVYRSLDSGATWTRVLSNNNVTRVLADSNDLTGQRLYAGHTTGVSVTINGGTSWFLAGNTGLPATINGTDYAITVDTANSMLYATVIGASGSGIYCTTTTSAAAGTASWSACNGTGLSSTQNLGRMTISPLNAAYRLVGERGVGLFGSSDSGATWSLILPNIQRRSTTSDPVDANIVYIGTNDGIYKTTNLTTGAPPTWTQLGASIPVASLNQINGGSNVPGAPQCTGYGATGTGVVKTTDCARTTSPTGAIAFNDVRSIGIDATTVHTTAYAGTNSGGVWKTTNGGTSWTQFNTGLPDVRGAVARSIQVDDFANVFVGFDQGLGIFKSAGGTGSWTSIVGSGLTNTTVYSVNVDPSNSNNIMIGTAAGVFSDQ